MSETIFSYCQTHDNELTHIFQKCLENVIFISWTYLEFCDAETYTIAQIQIGYTLTTQDLRLLFEILGDRYWGIRPLVGWPSYEIFIHLLDTDL